MIVGMAEDDATGEATGLVPLDPQPHRNEEDVRYGSIIAPNVFPHLDVATARVDVDGGSILLVSVAPSPLRSHAVYRDGSLRYPMRTGRTRRWLHEGRSRTPTASGRRAHGRPSTAPHPFATSGSS